jgi:hypothetical protein
MLMEYFYLRGKYLANVAKIFFKDSVLFIKVQFTTRTIVALVCPKQHTFLQSHKKLCYMHHFMQKIEPWIGNTYVHLFVCVLAQ